MTFMKNYWSLLPDFSFSHILLRIPLGLIFIQQGLSKLPFDPVGGEPFGLIPIVWTVVVYGEIGAGVGLLIGALATLPVLRDSFYFSVLGDLLTRFCGITMCCVTTGVIWVVIKPESLISFILADYLHFSLWAGGLYFGLRGNWTVASQKQQAIVKTT